MRERELIKAAFAGGKRGEEALAALLQANYRIVLGYFLKLTQDPELAKDLTQETMVRAIKNLRKYRSEAKFSSWLIAVGSNFYRDELRKKKAELKMSDGYLSVLEKQEETETVDIKRALLELPVEKRIPLILKYYYDYSYREIAAALKIPLGTVRSRLHSAVRQLRERLTEEPAGTHRETQGKKEEALE
ncbi:MAG: sigma-70 family RNA polymerase sigma factor [Firmicutes bacterium]|nr:sigma-70 family RNA polymerase sigma factor [Bacillota bacterium]